MPNTVPLAKCTKFFTSKRGTIVRKDQFRYTMCGMVGPLFHNSDYFDTGRWGINRSKVHSHVHVWHLIMYQTIKMTISNYQMCYRISECMNFKRCATNYQTVCNKLSNDACRIESKLIMVKVQGSSVHVHVGKLDLLCAEGVYWLTRHHE